MDAGEQHKLLNERSQNFQRADLLRRSVQDLRRSLANVEERLTLTEEKYKRGELSIENVKPLQIEKSKLDRLIAEQEREAEQLISRNLEILDQLTGDGWSRWESAK